MYTKALVYSNQRPEIRNEERDHLELLCEMPTYLIHSVDFSKFNSRSVYRYAERILVPAREISGIVNPSFMAAIQKDINEWSAKCHSSQTWFEVPVEFLKMMTVQ